MQSRMKPTAATDALIRHYWYTELIEVPTVSGCRPARSSSSILDDSFLAITYGFCYYYSCAAT
eukprot:6209066-Pleurochrysis_carterae.AAC.2